MDVFFNIGRRSSRRVEAFSPLVFGGGQGVGVIGCTGGGRFCGGRPGVDAWAGALGWSGHLVGCVGGVRSTPLSGSNQASDLTVG